MSATLRIIAPATLVAALGAGLGSAANQDSAAPATAGALPDVIGLRPGIPAQEAYNFLKAYDRVARVYVSDTPLTPITDKMIPFAIAMAEDEAAAEKIQADLTLPPSRQLVWRVARHLQFSEGKQTSIQRVVASLRDKYGAESYMASGRIPMLTWYFDEQGRRASVPGGINPANCAGKTGPTTPFMGVPASHGPQYLLLQPLPQSEQEAACRSLVVVYAMMNPATDDRLVASLDVIVADLPLETRAHNATAEALARGTAARQQHELDRASQQAEPKL